MKTQKVSERGVKIAIDVCWEICSCLSGFSEMVKGSKIRVKMAIDVCREIRNCLLGFSEMRIS